MSLTVKAYLTKVGHQQPEIRRFGIDADVSTNYSYLVGKIHSVFPGLANKTYTLGWRDAENDLIVFSSDDELTEALGYVNDGVFKVYIDEKQDEPRGPPPPFEEPGCRRGGHSRLHRHIVCDGCQGQVVGVRYKCEVCEDYDLCEGCKGAGLHPEHSFKAIEKPIRWGGRCGSGREMPGPNFPPFPCAFPAFPFPNQPPAGGCMPPGPPPFGEMTPEMMRAQRRAWRRWLRECFKNEKKQHKAEKRCKKDEKKQDKKDKKKKNSEEDKSGAPMDANDAEKKDQDSSSSSSSSSDEEVENSSPTEDYLKKVGHSVAAMLDPLGIEVEVDVEHHGQRRRCNKGGAWGAAWGPWGGMRGGHFGGRGHFGGGGHFGGPWGMGGARGGCSFRGRGAWPAYPFPQQPTEQSQSQPEKKTDEATSGQKSTPSHCDEQVNMETGESRRAEATPTSSNATEKDASNGNAEKTSPEVSGWTFVAASSSSSGNDVEGATAGVENLHVSSNVSVVVDGVPAESIGGATTSNTAATAYPPNPAVEEAMASLRSMGFTDNGGWLTALVTAHNGDVNTVLDYLHAGAKK